MKDKKWVYVSDVGPLEADLESLLEKLDAYQEQLLKLGTALMKADNGSFYPVDMLAIAVINRATSIISGYLLLVKGENFLCAGALVRMHLDNLLRFSSIHHVITPHQLALEILKGAKLNKIKDKEGHRMTDKYLVEKLSVNLPWVQSVYESTSGFVHLSNIHMIATFAIDEGESNDDELSIQSLFGGNGSSNIDVSVYKEATVGMIDITQQILKYLDGWLFTKSNPDFVQQMRDIDEQANSR